ncbi:hypothetical protein FE257_006015 [Aspergillus nanangensis]|uniref:Zn(2)-C6 fungal-type domain-containing protein n=1 Tax=Aspergillus nanangensis TaxID=2582783 RepID=A0AAD4CPM8_ASPNN|nr:hypothetical protein FE257_006015 [Aspergillus nanangensis]
MESTGKNPDNLPINRRRGKKSHGGCARCKLQRLKCSEDRPSCKRCVRVGVECPGYAQNLRWSRKYEAFSSSSSPVGSTCPTGSGHDAPRIVWQHFGLDLPPPDKPGDTDGDTQEVEPTIVPTSSNTAVTPVPATVANISTTMTAPDKIIPRKTPCEFALSPFQQLTGMIEQPEESGDFDAAGSPLLAPDFAGIFSPELIAASWHPTTSSPRMAPSTTAGTSHLPTIFGQSALSPPLSMAHSYFPNAPFDACAPTPLDAQIVAISPLESSSFLSDTMISVDNDPIDPIQKPRGVLDGCDRLRGTVTNNNIGCMRTLRDTSTILIEYYFNKVAPNCSCYDGSMNPFRTTISRVWDSSPVIYHTIKSMAAAYLAAPFPYFRRIGQQLRAEAICMLEEQTNFEENSLLALLMLSGTACWYDAGDLGVKLLNHARDYLRPQRGSQRQDKPVSDDNRPFFSEALIHLEMLLSYCTDDIGGSTSEAQPSSQNTRGNEVDGNITFEPPFCPAMRAPHPWTGASGELQVAIQEVGRLVRRQRLQAFSYQFATRSCITEMQQMISQAQKLQHTLLSFKVPCKEEFIDPADRRTPLWHLLTLTEVLRCVGLIQLYHVFPDLMQRFSASGTGSAAPQNRLFQDGVPDDPQSQRKGLTLFALQTLELLQSVPADSGTQNFQAFLLVALSSEMRMPATPLDPSAQEYETLKIAIRVSDARRMILSRLNWFLQVLPAPPIQSSLRIVQTTWERMDAEAEGIHSKAWSSEADVFWMDIMIDKKLETIL